MAHYTVASNNQPSGVGTAAIATATPSASVGAVLIDAYITFQDSSFGARNEIFRSTGGTVTGSQTPEKTSSRSPAAAAAGAVNWSTDPTKSGGALVELPFAMDGNRVPQQRWMPPDPRYPIYEDQGGSKLTLWSSSAGVIFSRYLGFAEPHATTFALGGMRGRRGRSPGYFQVSDGAHGFVGTSTSPHNGVGAWEYRYVQRLDWPDPVNASLASFLNLLNGGPVFDPSTLPWVPTLPDRFSVAPWNPERTETARAGWTQTTWAIPPTKIPEPILPERQARPVWDPERSQSVGIPYLPPMWPTTVVSPERNARPQWDPDRTASTGIPYLPPTWPTTVVAPERQARPAWAPERSHSVGIPYLPPTWPTTVVAPERNARPPWNPERSENARAGWIQALWAIAPAKIPEPVLPERFVAPWRPQDQQPVWPPFQFAAIVVPTWGYEVLGTQNVAIGWNPERGGLFISGFTPTVPVFGYEVHGPARLMLQWNPGRSESTRAGWIQSLWAIPPQNWQPMLPTQPHPLIAPDRSALCIPIVVASVPRTTVYAIFVFDD